MWLREKIDIPAFKILEMDFSSVDRREEDIEIPVSLELPSYASRSGSRLFLRPNLMNVWSTTPVEFPDRTQPVDMGFGFVDTDTIRYILPDGFVSESVPERVEIETDFGRYVVDYHMNAEEGTLLFTRTLEYRQRRLPASRYDEWRDFIRHAVTADRAQVVLVRRDV